MLGPFASIAKGIYNFFTGGNNQSASGSSAIAGGVYSSTPSATSTDQALYDTVFSRMEQIQQDNREAQAEQNRLEREFQAQSAADADRRWRENLQASTDAQRMLRQTQYSDYVDSLKAAGLNPLLADTNGVPSTPSVNSASHAASGGNSNVGIDTDSVSDYYNTLVSSAFSLTRGIVDTVGDVLGSSAKHSFLARIF